MIIGDPRPIAASIDVFHKESMVHVNDHNAEDLELLYGPLPPSAANDGVPSPPVPVVSKRADPLQKQTSQSTSAGDLQV
jgi:hypothetical protein